MKFSKDSRFTRMFPTDVLNEISIHSDLKSITSLLSVNKNMWEKRFCIYFYDQFILPDAPEGYYVSRLKNVMIEYFIRNIHRVNSITHLELGDLFDQPIDGGLPESLTHLTFGWCFNQSIENGLPKSMTQLVFVCHREQPIICIQFD